VSELDGASLGCLIFLIGYGAVAGFNDVDKRRVENVGIVYVIQKGIRLGREEGVNNIFN
jgi:hypothetical protein